MSRRTIDTSEDAGYDIIVGWDSALRTYYGQVIPDGNPGDDELILWVGKSPRELPTVDALADALVEWAGIDDQVRSELEKDRVSDL